MKSSLASLLILVLAFGAGPAFAASNPPPAPATDKPAAAAADKPAAEPSDDDTPAGSSPPIEAPVPDPFLADVYKICRDGASGDKGTFQRLQDAGWNLSVDGDTQTPFYQAFNGEKDYDGVGTVDITYSLEVYPALTEGYCSLTIDTAQRKIGIGDLAKMPGLKGEVRKTDDGLASSWQDNVTDPNTFVQADQHTKDLYFVLDVTTLMKKPAVDIPYVKPDPEDDTDNSDGTDNSDSSGSASN